MSELSSPAVCAHRKHASFVIASDCSFRNLLKKRVNIATVLSVFLLFLLLLLFCCPKVFIFHFRFSKIMTERWNLNHIYKKKLIQQQSRSFVLSCFLITVFILDYIWHKLCIYWTLIPTVEMRYSFKCVIYAHKCIFFPALQFLAFYYYC